ncbi:MAG: hypothetical protein EON86_10875 [Brevundimonas sp.]|nr:MAG: hypothetical protein EON86_10875 [Brevundimonas sp.]
MKRTLSAVAISAAIVMTGCNRNEDKGPAVDATPATAATDAETAAGPASAPSATTPSTPAQPAAPGAPEFAVVYPGGTPSGAPTVAQGPAGPGGILAFTTDASPDEVVTFYRQRAEASGLKPINSLNRDEARAYSAGDGGNRLLQVVATPIVDGPTDVQLTWSGG